MSSATSAGLQPTEVQGRQTRHGGHHPPLNDNATAAQWRIGFGHSPVPLQAPAPSHAVQPRSLLLLCSQLARICSPQPHLCAEGQVGDGHVVYEDVELLGALGQLAAHGSRDLQGGQVSKSWASQQ